MNEDCKETAAYAAIVCLTIGIFNICFGNGNGAIACAIVFAAIIWDMKTKP